MPLDALAGHYVGIVRRGRRLVHRSQRFRRPWRGTLGTKGFLEAYRQSGILRYIPPPRLNRLPDCRPSWQHMPQHWAILTQIAVGTVDQAMMGALKVRHGHMRAACLARNLLVVDEVHASDTYMRAIIEALACIAQIKLIPRTM